jgi:2',3'-cyclic-nucleotide 2'-phosphodiesterase (5'-nucleotidase family)
VSAGADGVTTLIVNTDNEYTYLGRLVVDFDAQGRIIPSSIDPLISGAIAATAANVAKAWNVSEAQLATTAFTAATRTFTITVTAAPVPRATATKLKRVITVTVTNAAGKPVIVRINGVISRIGKNTVTPGRKLVTVQVDNRLILNKVIIIK